MSLFTNKHVITAMIVAPILAVLTFYLVDKAVEEKPRAAVAGESYPLVAQSNCRFSSGRCDLQNTDVEARLTVEKKGNEAWLVVDSAIQLQNVQVAFAQLGAGAENSKSAESIAAASAPMPMQKNDHTGQWEIRAPQTTDENTQLMIVLQAQGVNYFADTTMAFSEYKTSFKKEF